MRLTKTKEEKRVNICGDCKREWNVPDCGAGVRDYEVIKGIGVVSCKKYLPKAPETTEILNEVKADKGLEGILTEEELKEPLGDVIGLYIGLYEGIEKSNLPKSMMLKHIQILLSEVKRSTKSEANYLSANAELSFYKNHFKEHLILIATSTTGLASNLKYIANSALEELKWN